MIWLIGVQVILLFSVLSCNYRTSQLSFQHIGDVGWKATDTFRFPIDSMLDPGDYSLTVSLRTSSVHRYPFRQLVLEVTQIETDGIVHKRDTLFCDLSQRDGEVNGRGVSVYAYDYLMDTIHLENRNHYEVSLRHLMRTSPLHGVYDVGVLVEKCHSQD